MIKLLVLFLTCSLFAKVIEAPTPQVDFNQNPSGMNWKEIETENFQIIFPEEVTAEAQRVAHLLEMSYPLVTRSLETNPKKIPIILQNQSTISNGFVTLAPFRSEFYLTPAVEPDLSNTEWLKTLAIHEFRHVVQMEKADRNFNKVFKFFLGEFGRAVGVGITMPRWYLEGDAVGTETVLTDGGRGRQPLFERDLRALLLSGREFSYDQTHMGSYKFYIPNHYLYGYFLTTFLREKHGDKFLSTIINYASNHSYNPLTFYNAYAKLTDKNFDDFYYEMTQELITKWQEKEKELKLTPYEVRSVKIKEDRTNYLYPQAFGEGKFVALKKGMSHIPQFVILDNKKEKTIFYPGNLNHEYPYKLRNGRMAYVEYEFDTRWGYRDYARIKVFDFNKKKHVSDLRKTKARLAVLDQSGENILFTEWDKNQRQRIVVRDLKGKKLFTLNYPKEKVITSLDWFGPDQIVLVIKDEFDKKSIARIDLRTGDEEQLLNPAFTNLGFITVDDDHILIESPESGIDNIYVLKNKELSKITTSRFGAYAPNLWKGKLYYNDYSANGMFIAEKKLDWDVEQMSENSFIPWYSQIAGFEVKKFNESVTETQEYEVKDYSQFKNAINLHSWTILAPPLSNTISLTAYSQDLLNKLTLSAGAQYHLGERALQGFASAAWSHLYPVFDIRAAYGSRRQEYRYILVEENDYWEEGTFEVGLQIPWKNISGRFLNQFRLRGFAKYIQVLNKQTSDTLELANSSLFSPGVELSFSSLTRLAMRDLNPKWGVSFQSKYEDGKNESGDEQFGSILTLDSKFYLPGVLNHHSFYHQLAYEKQDSTNYEYASFIQRPRGTESFFLDDIQKYSANYTFPFLYPDWSLGPYLYFNRFSLNLFYDQMNAKLYNFSYEARSTGVELLIETNIVRFFVPISWGVRSNFVLDGAGEKQSFDIFLTTIGGYF